jgi:hypothetical protein
MMQRKSNFEFFIFLDSHFDAMLKIQEYFLFLSLFLLNSQIIKT